MTVRVGIAGAGGISRSHLAGLSTADNATVTAVYDLDANRAAELAATCAAAATNSLDELLDACDAVIVCTPTAAHRAIVEQVAARGLAVLCEKPLAPNLADAQAMGEAVRAAGVINQVGLPLRRRPPFAVLHHLLADPANGAILGVSMHTISRGRAGALRGWRGDVSVAGGGMLIEVGFHDLDLLQWLAGPVAAATGYVTGSAQAGIEDAAAVSLAFANGGSGALLAAWNDAPIPGQSRRVQVVCENAEYILEVDGLAQRLVAGGPGERHQEWDGDGLASAAVEFGIETNPQAAFVHAVEQGVPASPTIADAVEVQVMLDRVYRDAASRPAATPR